MSRDEVKTAISELLDNTPEEVLHEVFDYLKTVQGQSNETVSLSRNLRAILIEDKEFLQRLAQ